MVSIRHLRSSTVQRKWQTFRIPLPSKRTAGPSPASPDPLNGLQAEARMSRRQSLRKPLYNGRDSARPAKASLRPPRPLRQRSAPTRVDPALPAVYRSELSLPSTGDSRTLAAHHPVTWQLGLQSGAHQMLREVPRKSCLRNQHGLQAWPVASSDLEGVPGNDAVAGRVEGPAAALRRSLPRCS